jgi:hypothetical protein
MKIQMFTQLYYSTTYPTPLYAFPNHNPRPPSSLGQRDFGHNVHGLQFLKQQFRRVRHFNRRQFIFQPNVFTIRTFPRVGQQTTRLTHRRVVHVTGIHQAFQQQRGSPVPNQAIAFHFPQTQTPVPRSSLRRLPRQLCSRSSGSSMHFVQHHVFQFLVVHWAHEYERVQWFSSAAVGQDVYREGNRE